MENRTIPDIDAYIAGFPIETREKLQQIRQTIQEAAPDAKEVISYQMPTFKLNGNLVHFAAYKNHIGFYPAPRAIEAFKEELSNWNGSKGTVQFPLDAPLPLDLIRRIVLYRVNMNLEKSKNKTTKQKAN